MLKKFDIAPVWMGVALLVVMAFRPVGASPGLLALLAGTALLAAGGGLVFLAFREFERHGTDGTPGAVPRVLVTTGPFRYTRNPIYLAGVLIVAGLSLVLGSPIGLIVATQDVSIPRHLSSASTRTPGRSEYRIPLESPYTRCPIAASPEARADADRLYPLP
jgi:hypothetical protein